MNPIAIKDRLNRYARNNGLSVDAVNSRYAHGQALYRIVEMMGDKMILKGGLLHYVNEGDTARQTMDADIHFPEPQADLEKLIPEILQQKFFDSNSDSGLLEDGVFFEEFKTLGLGHYEGIRVKFKAWIGRTDTSKGTRVNCSIDIGNGKTADLENAVVKTYPSIFPQLPPVRVLCQSDAAIISEKLHAVAFFGSDNTRLRDYYDLYRMLETGRVNDSAAVAAVVATFSNNGTDLNGFYEGTSDAFVEKNADAWTTMLSRSNIKLDKSLKDVMDRIKEGYTVIVERAKLEIEQENENSYSYRPKGL